REDSSHRDHRGHREENRIQEPLSSSSSSVSSVISVANLLFEVCDTGIGIPKEKQRAVFEPFVQADGSMTRRYGGTGLGLAIAQSLVGMMGGAIELASEPGGGSTFRFRVALPVQPGGGEEAPELGGAAVLVVEGHAATGRFLAEALAEAGARPTV